MNNKVDLKNLIEDLNKESSNKSCMDLTTPIKSDIKYYCSSGSKLFNMQLSGKADGGFPCGRIIEIFGSEGTGKTTFAVEAIKAVQKNHEGIGVFIDTEDAFSRDRAKQLGLDETKTLYHNEEFPTIESTFTFVENLLKNLENKSFKVPVVIVWDSIAATSAKAEVEGTYDQSHMGLHARAYSQGFRKLGGRLAKANACLLLINQVRDKIGTQFPVEVTFGGRAIPFYSSIRVQLKKGELITFGTNNVGHLVNVTTVKNKIFRPLIKTSIPLFYEEGINEVYGWFMLLYAQGKIKQAGGWFTYKNKSFHKGDWFKLMQDEKFYKSVESLIDKFDISTNTFIV